MRRESGGTQWVIRAVAIVAVLTAGALAVPLTPAQPGARVGQVAPEITGASWLNSEPLSLAGLRGRVVFVEFWTFGCVNCQNVLPQLRGWHERYGPAGLTIVGVHSPEFLWEKPPVAQLTLSASSSFPAAFKKFAKTSCFFHFEDE